MIINNPKFTDLDVGDMLTAHNNFGIARCLIWCVGFAAYYEPATVTEFGDIESLNSGQADYITPEELAELCANDNMTVKLLKQGTFNAEGEKISE